MRPEGAPESGAPYRIESLARAPSFSRHFQGAFFAWWLPRVEPWVELVPLRGADLIPIPLFLCAYATPDRAGSASLPLAYATLIRLRLRRLGPQPFKLALMGPRTTAEAELGRGALERRA